MKIVLFLLLAAVCALSISNFSNGISIASESSSPFPENGIVTIAFDDNGQSQYGYAWPLLRARGMKATFYITTDRIGGSWMSVAELQDLQNAGCEIASHSKTHVGFTGISDSQIREECSVSKQVLQSYGFTVNNFAYPYGVTNDHVDSIVKEYYRSGRSAYTPPYLITLPTSQFRLPGFPGETGDTNALTQLKSMVDQVYNSKGWTIVFFHGVVPNPTGNYQIGTSDFSKFLDYVTAKSVATLTVNQALDIGSRDVTVKSVVPSAFQAVVGTIIKINVTVKNEGSMTETFNLTTYYDNNRIETQAVTDLASGATRTLTFNWNTDALPPGNYTIKAEASTVSGETDTADNTYVDGTIRIVKTPIASFTYSPSKPRINEPVLFDASSSAPNGGTITSYKWNFEDGNTTSTPSPTTTHVYTIPRTYDVTLTITDSEGLNASAWNSIVISAPIQTKISIFTYSSSNYVGFKVEINGTLTDSGENGISHAGIIVSYTLPDISEWVPFASATTDIEGNYYSQWIPPSTGDFTLKAEWIGNQKYSGANKNTTLSIIPYEDMYIFSVASNSTISALAFNSTSSELSFTATGPSRTTGLTKVTIAKALVADITNLKVYLDGKPLEYSIPSAADSWIVSFAYTHSTHQVTLILNPEAIQPHLRGDINNDGQVNMLDLTIVASAFSSRPGDPKWNSTADLDSNGVVNVVDIAMVAKQYGKTV